MRANYHTHTPRCRHATGSEREYIENAVRAGMEVLGFSDHAPYPFPEGYVSGIRMGTEEYPGYVETLRALREEYADRIRILIGLEAEYYPKHFSDFEALIGAFPPDYLILGQHATNNEYDGTYAGNPEEDPAKALERLKRYVDQTIRGLETGRFCCLAHPDVCRFGGDPDLYLREMEKLCRYCLEKSIPLEINLLGVRTDRHYPREDFWQLAGRIGNTAILGADAHRAQDVSCPEAEEKGRALAARCGLALLEELPL